MAMSKPNGKRIKRKVIAVRFGLSISRIKGIVAKERERRFVPVEPTEVYSPHTIVGEAE